MLFLTEIWDFEEFNKFNAIRMDVDFQKNFVFLEIWVIEIMFCILYMSSVKNRNISKVSNVINHLTKVYRIWFKSSVYFSNVGNVISV